MRLASVEVSGRLFERFVMEGMKGGPDPWARIAAALPADATLVRTADDLGRGVIRYTYESKSFDPIAVGASIPVIDVGFPAR